MTTRFAVDRRLTSVVALLLLLISASTWGAFGRTAGSANVTDSGQSSYSIPLFTPPGTNGLTPSLSLEYNSGSGESPFGFGWSLSGWTGISRCALTWAQDGTPRNVYNTLHDRFCLDGSRLRLISGTYGVAGSVYRTEVETYSRITAYGVAGNGPSYFIVERKDGLIYEYGNTEDSRVQSVGSSTARFWAVNKIRDRSGNSIVFNYVEDTTNGDFRISTIQYTQNTALGLAPTYTVAINYSSIPSGEVTVKFVAASIVKRMMRATSIDVSSAATLVRRYVLAYEANLSNTAKSRLASVQECAGASGTDCLTATTFIYQNGTPGVGTEVNSGVTTSGTSTLPLDINGDGRTDAVYASGGVWMVMFANGSGGYNTPVNTGIASTNSTQAIPLDYNADGLEDLLVPYSGSTWWVIQGTASGLALPFDTLITATGAGGNARAMDVNGDGLDDLVFAIVTGSQHSVQARFRVWGGTFGTASYLYGPISAPDEQIVGPVFGTTQFRSPKRNPDVNGDGLADFIIHRRVPEVGIGYLHFWEVVRSGSLVPVPISNLDLSAGPYWPDLNGDGCSDLVYTRGNNWRYRFGDCFGIGAEKVGPLINSSGMQFTVAAVYDWDGDGFDDIVGRDGLTGRWDYMRSNGEALQAIVDSGITTSATSFQVVVGDANGDGLDDLLYNNSSFVRMHHLHAGVTSDLLLTATDGFGEFSTFSYTTLPQNNYTKGSGNGLSFPYVDWQGAMPIVSSKQSSDGNGGSYLTNYWYFGAVNHLQGRGLTGFWKIKQTDLRNGIVQYRFLDQLFPLTGALKQLDTWQPSETALISRSVTTNTPVVIDATVNNERHTSYASASVSLDYEVSGNVTFNGALLRTVTTANSYDSATGTIYDTTVTTTEPASSANGATAGGSWSLRTYIPLASLNSDVANWCIGQPGELRQINSHNLTYGSQITRITSATWDLPMCRLTQIVDEPGNSTLQRTTSIGYDSFGNPNTRTTTGVGMTGRTTTAIFSNAASPTGQFPLSTTNALSQTTAITWNYELGVPASVTDPNGVVTSWQYDGFGRRTREDRADGTYTTWAFASCPSCDSRVKTFIDENSYSSTSSLFKRRLTYLDQLDREIFNYGLRPDGYFSVLKRSYDSLGRVFREDFPYSTGGSEFGFASTSYDLLNRPVQMSRPTSETVAALQYFRIYYEGLTTRSVDEQDKESKKVASANGELVRSIDAAGHYQHFDYDSFGNPTRVQDSSGNVLQSSYYNLRGALTARTDMDLGSWGYSPNALGETVSQTNAKGQTTTFSFDLLGRLVSRTEAEGTSTWTWGSSSALHNIGQLQNVSGVGYSEAYAYDSIGRPSGTIVTADTTYQIDFSYNSSGSIDTLTYPTSTSSYRLKLQYDYQNGELYRIKDFNAPTTIFWAADTFNARGKVVQESLGNGLLTNRVFDAITGWIRTIKTGAGGGTGVQNLAYTWDLVGNLSSRKDVNQANLTEAFIYDNLYRLDYSQLNGVTNQDLSYDALGNITSNNLVPPGASIGIGSYNYHASKKHQVTSTGNSWSFAYDNNGNMTSGRGATITWTSYDTPATITNGSQSSTFSYTPDRQYWKQVGVYSDGTATTIYVGGLLEKVTTTTPTNKTDFRHRIRAGSATIIVSRQTAGTNTVNYVTSDHMGNSSAITNSAGAILVNSSFGAFGQRRGSNWSGSPSSADWAAIASTTRRGYTDHSMLDNLNLIHMNGRVQDPLLGKFLSADPFITEPLNTQNYNRYSYVYNNPLRYSDPSGFGAERPCSKPGTLCKPRNTGPTTGNGSTSNNSSTDGKKGGTRAVTTRTSGDPKWDIATNYGQSARCIGSCGTGVNLGGPAVSFSVVTESVTSGGVTSQIPIVQIFFRGTYLGNYNPLNNTATSAYDSFSFSQDFVRGLNDRFSSRIERFDYFGNVDPNILTDFHALSISLAMAGPELLAIRGLIAARVFRSGTAGTSGELITVTGNRYFGNSVGSAATGGTARAPMNSQVQQALNAVSNPSRTHGFCCEIDAFNKVLNAGDILRGARMGEVRLNETGRVLGPCSTCREVKTILGVE